MVDDGIGGVKIQRLCDRLGVTKGSFYWHFVDLDAFLGELASRYEAEGQLIKTSLGDEADPAASLLEAMTVFADRRNRNLARAMRDWARTDPRARAAIRNADRALFERVRDLLVAAGFEGEEAEVRAKILVYAGIGFAHVGQLGSSPTGQEQLAATLEILTRR
jgi:AcrR family transcriptional regulator